MLAIADVQPAGAVTLPAPLFILGSGRDAGGASFPIGIVRSAPDDARAPLACSQLGTLPIDHLRGIRDGPAPRTNCHGLWLLAGSFIRFGVWFALEHGCIQAQAVPMLGIRSVQVECHCV